MVAYFLAKDDEVDRMSWRGKFNEVMEAGRQAVLRSHPSCTQDVLQDLSGSWLLVFVLLQQVVLPSSFYNLMEQKRKV